MGKANLRETLDAFADNVKAGHPTDLRFDGKMLYLSPEATAGAIQSGAAKCGITSDLTDDTVYRLIGDDIRQVAEARDVKLTEDEMARMKKGIEAGMGNCWWDIVESAMIDVLAERKEENERSETGD